MQLVLKFLNSGSVKRVNKSKQRPNNNSTREAVRRLKNKDYREDPKAFYENGSQPLAPMLMGFSKDTNSDPNESGYMQEMLLPQANVFPNDLVRNDYLDKQWDSYMRERSANSVWSNAVSTGLTGPTASFWAQIAEAGIGGSLMVTVALPILVDLAYDMAGELSAEEMATVGRNVVNYFRSSGPGGAQGLRQIMLTSGPRTVSQLLRTPQGMQALMQLGNTLALTQSVDLTPYIFGTATATALGGVTMSEDAPSVVIPEEHLPYVPGPGSIPGAITVVQVNADGSETSHTVTVGGGNSNSEPEVRPDKPKKKGFFERLFRGKKPDKTVEEPTQQATLQSTSQATQQSTQQATGNTSGTSNPTPSSNASNVSNASGNADGWWNGWNKGWNYIKPWKPQGIAQWTLNPLWYPSREHVWPAIDKTAGRAVNWFVTGKAKPFGDYMNDSTSTTQPLQDPLQLVAPADTVPQNVTPTDTTTFEEPEGNAAVIDEGTINKSFEDAFK